MMADVSLAPHVFTASALLGPALRAAAEFEAEMARVRAVCSTEQQVRDVLSEACLRGGSVAAVRREVQQYGRILTSKERLLRMAGVDPGWRPPADDTAPTG
jgi:hypothetical protein